MPDNRKGSGRKGSYNYYRAALSLATIPLMIGVAPAIGWWLGRLADRKFGTDWIFQAIGVVLGLGAAVRETVFLIRRAQKDLDE